MNQLTVDALEQALLEAGAAHRDYERVVLRGNYDELWPGFYAAFALGRFGGFATCSTLSRWLEQVPSGDNWARSAAEHVLAEIAREQVAE